MYFDVSLYIHFCVSILIRFVSYFSFEHGYLQVRHVTWTEYFSAIDVSSGSVFVTFFKQLTNCFQFVNVHITKKKFRVSRNRNHDLPHNSRML